ncbi:MAG: DUF6057 family protein [Bacteroidales bacterium]|nr:DUF6057 family protein [Bacteroidales bacterium]
MKNFLLKNFRVKRKRRIKKSFWYGGILALLVLGLSLYQFTSVFDRSPEAKYERIVTKINTAIENDNWHDILLHGNNLLQLISNDLKVGKVTTDQVEILWAKLVVLIKYALIHTGELLENFFSYSDYYGFQNLIGEQESHIFLLRASYLFLADMELHAMALASAFNQFEVWGKPFVLNDFIKSSLIVGDYGPLETFVNRLEQFPKWRKQARTYRAMLADTAKINADPYYIHRRSLGPQRDFLAGWNFDRSISELHFANPNNQRAFEYTLAFVLLNKMDHLFAKIETLIENFDYEHIPRHLEEAILGVVGYGWNSDISREMMMNQTYGGLTIRPETIFRHENFVHHLAMLQQGQLSEDWFKETYQDTYQYHYLLRPLE